MLDLWAVTVFARVSDLGGEIRHPEIRAGFVPPARPDSDGDEAREP